MKVLFITYYFAPYNTIGAVRTTRTAEKLIELGYDVKVISANKQNLPDNLSTSFPQESTYRTKWFNPSKFVPKKALNKSVNYTSDGKKLKSIRMLLNKIYTSLFSYPDDLIGWFLPARKQAAKLINNGWVPDLIYASATPYTSLLVAKSVSGKYSIPWVAELRDLWADNHYIKSNWIDQLIEKRTLTTANSLVTVSEPLANRLAKKYTCPVSVIYNAYDKADFSGAENDSIGRDSDTIKIVYTGTVYEDRQDPTPLLLALASNETLKSKVSVDFYGQKLSYISYLTNKYKLEDCVFVHDPVTRAESLKIQRAADILLLLTWNDEREKGILTGKLFEYIGSGKAILSIGAIEDDASKIVTSNQFGIASNTPEDLLNFLLNFDAKQYRNLSNRYKYERTFQINKLISLFDSVVNN